MRCLYNSLRRGTATEKRQHTQSTSKEQETRMLKAIALTVPPPPKQCEATAPAQAAPEPARPERGQRSSRDLKSPPSDAPTPPGLCSNPKPPTVNPHKLEHPYPHTPKGIRKRIPALIILKICSNFLKFTVNPFCNWTVIDCREKNTRLSALNP